MSSRDEYESVLKLIREWPAELRFAFAHELLGDTPHPSPVASAHRLSFERALGLGRGDQPPPTDAEVKQWIDEHRMERHG